MKIQKFGFINMYFYFLIEYLFHGVDNRLYIVLEQVGG